MLEWKPLKGFEESYLISNAAQVKCIETGKLLKPYPYPNKYTTRVKVFLRVGERYNKDYSYKLADLANLVASAFLSKSEDPTSNIVDFKDGNPLNCTAPNLYYRKTRAGGDESYNALKYRAISDDVYINEAIKVYRELYPNDYYLEDDDIRQELLLKMWENKNKGYSRTNHFKGQLGIIHNTYKPFSKQTSNIVLENYDEYKDMIENEWFEDKIDSIDDVGYAVKNLSKCLETLNPREEELLRLRYGLLDGEVKSLEEAGKYFNVTRERIRQIEAKAMRKLRHPSRLNQLRKGVRTNEEALPIITSRTECPNGLIPSKSTRNALKYRYGIENHSTTEDPTLICQQKSRSHENVGKKFGVSKEFLIETERNILKKYSFTSYIKYLTRC